MIHLSVTRKCQILLLCWAVQSVGEFNEEEREVWLLHSKVIRVLGTSCKVSFPENRKINRIWWSKKMLKSHIFSLYEFTLRIEINFEMKGIEDLVDSLINCVPGHELPERTAVRRHAGRKWSYKKTTRKFQSHLYVSYGITTVDPPCRSCNFLSQMYALWSTVVESAEPQARSRTCRAKNKSFQLMMR
jgi:hypothetical protein